MSSEATGPDEVVRARGLTKIYPVYARPEDRLKQILWRGRRRFYREFAAVRGVDLDVLRGETLGVVGRNGSGKSTLLRMIAGTLPPTGGELAVRGAVAPILALGAGFNPEFTGRENVLMNATVLGMSEAAMRGRLDAIVDFADIGEFFDQPVKAYSTGMYARLAFAVAIHTEPEILVVDEILAVGDEPFARKCFGRIEELKARGVTILFCSHAAHLIVELCDRALLLDHGRRLLLAEPRRVIARYHELVHAPAERQAAIASDILQEDRLGAPPARAASAADAGPAEGPREVERGRYEPGLRPESTVVYPPKGARIRDAGILGADGEPVNVLQPEADYVYAYEVEFLETSFGVRFGMMLKLVSGFELYGRTSHPPGKGIDCVEAGTMARVRFPFRTRLRAGPYFLNAGVLGFREGEEVYLHRILDACLFRIEFHGHELLTGRVDLSVGSPCQIDLDGRNG